MNRQAIAMAADSAVTIARPSSEQDSGGKKVYMSANKIFSLSSVHPIGIMVYAASSFMQVPWEVITKQYRSYLGNRSMNTVQDYSNDFFSFIEREALVPPDVQETDFKASIAGLCHYVKAEIRKAAAQQIRRGGRISLTETKRIVSKIINLQYRAWRDAEYLASAGPGLVEQTREKHGAYIRKSIDDVFGSMPASAAQTEKIVTICCLTSAKLPQWAQPPHHSGVVFAGFGSKEVFPALRSFVTGGMYENVLHYRPDEANSGGIDFTTSARMVPLAQRDVVDLFVTGMDPRLGEFIDGIIHQLCFGIPRQVVDGQSRLSTARRAQIKKQWNAKSEILVEKLRDKILAYRKKVFAQPVIRTVSSMPKDELAATAEALVSLTSLSRRVTTEIETVGGPVDVAVISKGDGFVWINRKHYFKGELNPRFLSRCAWEVRDAKTD